MLIDHEEEKTCVLLSLFLFLHFFTSEGAASNPDSVAFLYRKYKHGIKVPNVSSSYSNIERKIKQNIYTGMGPIF